MFFQLSIFYYRDLRMVRAGQVFGIASFEVDFRIADLQTR
jgi:hypothetical protein